MNRIEGIAGVMVFRNVIFCLLGQQKEVLKAVADEELEVKQLDYTENSPLGHRSLMIVLEVPKKAKEWPDIKFASHAGNIYTPNLSMSLDEMAKDLEEAGLKVAQIIPPGRKGINHDHNYKVVADWAD